MEGSGLIRDPGSQSCDNCQGLLPPASKFCPNCGAPRPILDNPLGPKTLGEILGGAFQNYRAGFLGIVIIVAVVQVPLSLFGFWIGPLLESALVELEETFYPQFDSSFDIASLIEALRPVYLLFASLIIASWLTSSLMNGALIYGVSGQMLGKPISVGRAYSFSIGRYGAMLGASFLAGLAVILMAITFIGIPFAIFFAVRWFFVYQTASLERCGPRTALARSSGLVRGNWWRVFGILLLIAIILAIANGITSAILVLMPFVGSILLVVFAVLLAPIMVLAATLLYHDLRVRRDGPLGYDPVVLASEMESPRAL